VIQIEFNQIEAEIPPPNPPNHFKLYTSYTPKYVPPPEPTVLPVPDVETVVNIPDTMNANAHCLRSKCEHPLSQPIQPSTRNDSRRALRSPMSCASRCLRMKGSATSRYKVILKGLEVEIKRNAQNEGDGRRKAIEALLGETEKKVGKELMSS